MDPASRLSFIHKVNVARDRLADGINIAALAGGERHLSDAACCGRRRAGGVRSRCDDGKTATQAAATDQNVQYLESSVEQCLAGED